MILTLIAMAVAVQLGAEPAPERSSVHQVQYCGNGYDVDIHGRCYPNGVIPPQYQAARRYGGAGYGGGYYGGGPVPCGGDGVDLDVRDGRCYPTGTVPRRYQNRPHYYNRY
jgi:hypothetical protein